MFEPEGAIKQIHKELYIRQTTHYHSKGMGCWRFQRTASLCFEQVNCTRFVELCFVEHRLL